MKVGLCLGGGGARGYAHIGAIRALTEANIKIDIINGTSIGAVVGGAYALYQDIDKMIALTKQVVESVNINHFNLFRHSIEGPSFLRNWLNEAVCEISTLRRSIQSHKNNIQALKLLFSEYRFEDTRIPFSAITTDLIKGETIVIKKGKLIDGVLASISLPGIFPPISHGRKLLVDGFVLSNVPAPELRQEGADFIISVELDSKGNAEYQTGMDILNYIGYLKQERLQQWAIKESDFNIKIEMPDFDSSHFENYIKAMDIGYKTTRRIIPRLKKKLEKIND